MLDVFLKVSKHANSMIAVAMTIEGFLSRFKSVNFKNSHWQLLFYKNAVSILFFGFLLFSYPQCVFFPKNDFKLLKPLFPVSSPIIGRWFRKLIVANLLDKIETFYRLILGHILHCSMAKIRKIHANWLFPSFLDLLWYCSIV